MAWVATATPLAAHTTVREENCESTMSKTAKQLKEEARAALGAEAFRADLAPALPTQWPPPGGGIVFYVYRAESLPTGRVRYEVRGPSQRIVFADPAAAPVVESITPVLLGEEDQQRAWPAGFNAQLERAEEALVDIVAGRRTAEDGRPALQAYATWMAHSALVAHDLHCYAASFLAWLQDK
jgi:hypothetical protein